MKAGWKIALAFLMVAAGVPLTASAGHGHHRHHGGGHGYGGGYGGGCGCGTAAPAYYPPPANVQYGQPTPAGGQGGGYQSFSYSPEAGAAADVSQAPPPVMSGPAYYPQPAAFAPNYYGGYSGGYSNNRREARAYNNAANKSLGNHDYGIGR